jgi:hypothetical protein
MIYARLFRAEIHRLFASLEIAPLPADKFLEFREAFWKSGTASFSQRRRFAFTLHAATTK